MKRALEVNKHINRLYIVALFGITPMIVTFDFFDNYSFGKVIFAAIITIAYWIYNAVIGNDERNNLKLDIHILILFALLIISTFLSTDNTVSIFGVRYAPEGFVSISLLLIIVYVFYNFVKIDESSIEWVLLCSLIISIIAICEFVGLVDPIITITDRTYFYPVNFTTIGNRNFLGTYSIIMFSMAISLCIFCKKKRAIFYTVVHLVVALMSQTRSAYIALFIIVVLAIVLVSRTKRAMVRYVFILIFCFCFGVVCLYLISYILDDNRIWNRIVLLLDSVRNIQIDPNGTDRLSLWYRMFPFVLERPLIGFGPDTFGTLFQRNFGFLELIYHKAHNEWLQIILTLGIPYFLLFISLKYKAFKNTILNMKEHPLYQMMVLVLIGYIVQSFFNISVAGNSFIFYGILGLALKEPDRISFDGKDKEYIRGS